MSKHQSCANISPLPADIHQRLIKLRNTDETEISNPRYNKTSRYMFFGSDKLDTLEIGDLYKVLRDRYPVRDIYFLLCILLGYGSKRVIKIISGMIYEFDAAAKEKK